jgi:hypothetical protein
MVDLDNVLKLATPKYVYIRNAKLGIMKYSFMIMIFVYVIVYEIMYSCTHLEPHHASGFGEIAIEHPTEKCDPLDEKCKADFSSISDKKYCSQFTGDADSDEKSDEKAELERRLKDKKEKKSAKKEDDKDSDDGDKTAIGKYITKPKLCRYFDGQRAMWAPPQPSEIFIPTYYESLSQEVQPECYDPEIKGVKGQEGGRSAYECLKPWVTKESKEFFIANIEDFDLELQHTFEQSDIGLAGTSLDYQGFFAACKSNHPESLDKAGGCIKMLIPNSTGDVAPEDLVGLTTAKEEGMLSLSGTSRGDRIRFGNLLKATPIAQNYKSDLEGEVLDVELPAKLGHPGKSLREVGGMLLLDVNYDNFGYGRPGITFGGYPESFAVKPVTYTYRAYFIPMKKNLKMQILQDKDFPQKRTVDRWYGVTVRMQFNGKLVAFSMDELLTGLSASLVLVTSATTIVTMIAVYILPLKEKYNLLMYQMSEDFSDYISLKHNSKKTPVQSRYSTGQTLLDRYESNDKVIKDEELIKILCSNEMRLNRLDGMDPMCVFIEDEKDVMCEKIGELQKTFYESQGLTSEFINNNCSARVTGKIQGEYKSVPSGP